MCGSLLHLVKRLAMLAPLVVLVASCEATWPGQGNTPAGPRYEARCPTPVPTFAGDTVYSVARRCGVSVRDLIEANGLQPPYTLTAGMQLRMPGAAAEHLVQKGDTLSVIARRYHVDFQALASLNAKSPPYTIRIGEKLRLPGTYAVPASPPSSNSPPPSNSIVVNSPNQGRATTPPPAPATRVTPTAPPPTDPAKPVPPTAPPAPPQPASLPPDPGAVTGRGFLWPVKGEVIIEFGPQANKGQQNDGINIAAAKGTPVKAAENGVVAYVGNELKGFGNLILVKHADGWMTAYAHNDQVMIKRGEPVRRGQQIGTVGSTGSVTTPQLHFEMRHGTEAVNPLEHLKDGPVS